MRVFRRIRLSMFFICLCVPVVPPIAAQAPPQQQPPPVPPVKPPAGQQQTPPPQRNPFETVPQTPQQQPPPATTPPPQPAQPPKPEQPTPLQPVPQAQPPDAPKPTALPGALTGQPIEQINFQGARRVPQDTLKALIFSHVGDLYNEETLRRDFMALWNTSRFDDIRLEVEPGQTGLIIRFVVTERRVIRSINYEGIKSVTVSEILDRFKERKVGLSTESQYDPDKIQRATVALKDFLSERGRQYAVVDPQIEQIPPSSLKLTFNVNEGPKVKVGDIDIVNNKAYNDRWVIRHMKQLKPIGVPHSIFLENLFAKTFDQNKLEYDKEMIRMAYTDNGYFAARVLDETVKITPKGGRGWRLPLIKMNNPGIAADLTIPVEEGRLYKLRNANFMGVKFFKDTSWMLNLFAMQQGDVFSTDKLRKGLENLRKVYGQFGFIDFVPEPSFDMIPNTDWIDLTLTADEGKQFFVRRIDFSGNTTTRDKVIRREILIDEGAMFNSQLW